MPSWFCATTSLYGAVYVPTAGTPSAFLRYWRLPKLQVSRRFVESSRRRNQRIGEQRPFERQERAGLFNSENSTRVHLNRPFSNCLCMQKSAKVVPKRQNPWPQPPRALDRLAVSCLLSCQLESPCDNDPRVGACRRKLSRPGSRRSGGRERSAASKRGAAAPISPRTASSN